MKILYVFIAALLFPVLAWAQTGETDLSKYEIVKEGQATLSLSEIELLERGYKDAVSAGDCADAIPKIIEFYEAANLAANLIRRGNEPYYDARRDDQNEVAANRDLLNILISAENTFNELIRQRNAAWVAEAKCLLAEGENQAAIHRLYRALDYIGTSYDERSLWEEARTLLWNEVGFSPN